MELISSFTPPKRKMQDTNKIHKKLRSDKFVADERIISPLTTHIKFLSFGSENEGQDRKKNRKRKADPVEELIETRIFSKMKINEEEDENDNKIDTPLKLNYDNGEQIIENKIHSDEKFVINNTKNNFSHRPSSQHHSIDPKKEEDKKEKNENSILNNNTVFTIYTKINNFLKQLTFERLSRKDK